jgi:hypothetical protein
MFMCERCGSRYSPRHAAALENCPRCQIRERVSSPLYFKVFSLPEGGWAEATKDGDAGDLSSARRSEGRPAISA